MFTTDYEIQNSLSIMLIVKDFITTDNMGILGVYSILHILDIIYYEN